jgi:Tol biopolymer transport system component
MRQTRRVRISIGLCWAVLGVTTGLATLAATAARAGVVAESRRCLIAFDRNDAGTNLAVYDTVSGRIRDITYGGGDDTTPAWSPDGAHLAFARLNAANSGANRNDSHIWITDLADNERQLTTGRADDFAPAWSPDGRLIAFSRAGDVYLVNVRTRRVERITNLGQTVGYLSWAPGGRRLAYETLQGIKTVDLPSGKSRLVIPHASNPQYLPDGGLAYRVGDTFHGRATSLTISFAGRGQWNPQATSLVFASRVDDQLTSPPPPQLYVERVAAPHPRHLYVSHFPESPTWRPTC